MKRKHYLELSKEDRAKIGQYTAENGNNSAVKKFRAGFPDLGESTVRLHKMTYLASLVKWRKNDDDCPSSILSKKKGKLSIGELDKEVSSFNITTRLDTYFLLVFVQVQGYVRALTGSAFVIAAAKGIVTARKPSLG